MKKEIEKTTPNLAALEVINFGKKYNRRKDYAVKNASFTVMPGEFHGFIGANGAGKTTTIKSIIGAYATYEGKVNIFGHKNTTKKAKLRMGYIPESANFPKSLNTVEYISRMATLAGMSLRKAKIFARDKIKELGLINIAYKKPFSFSSGQKKKVLLAQALINDPDFIVMDEPAANLDPKARNDFFNTLKELQKKGKAILISSHILAELDHFVDSVTILDGGNIVFSGKTTDLVQTSENLYHIEFKNKEHSEAFNDYVIKNKLKNSPSLKYKDGVSIDFPDYKDAKKALQFITSKKLDVIVFSKDRTTLQQAYNKYVSKGSVDTGINSKGGQ